MMREFMQFRDLLVCDILDFAAANHGDTEVVSAFADGTVVRHGYLQIQERAKRAANALTDAGFARGDAIATLGWNDHRHLELYYAIPGIGGAIHTINPRVSADQIAYMIETAKDKALAFDPSLSDLVSAIVARIDRPLTLIEMCSGPAQFPAAIGYENFIKDASPQFQWVSVKETDPFGICFTSGTTGNPKAVVYTHRSTVLHAMACCMAEAQAVSGRETILPVVPMFHANAWGLAHSAPMAGAKLVLPGPRLDGNSVLDLAVAEQVTFICGVPTVWQAILDVAEQQGRTLSPIKRAGMGGSAPSRLMVERLEHAGLDVFHAWGMTETNPSAGTGFLKAKHLSLNAEDKITLKLGQGRPIFGLQRKIVDDDGHDLPTDGQSAGRLMVSGNWVVGEYMNAEGSPLEEGWFDTGDIATIDKDGYMKLVDRSKDLIKSGGEWISSIEVESHAQGVPGVLHAAALAEPDPKWGERPVLVVSRQPGFPVSDTEILTVLATKLVKWQVPDKVIFRDALPMTATGKIDKRRLREEIFGGIN
jgi:fatty-acyl-CoA synthase